VDKATVTMTACRIFGVDLKPTGHSKGVKRIGHFKEKGQEEKKNDDVTRRLTGSTYKRI
jgi:hypothetical protein